MANNNTISLEKTLGIVKCLSEFRVPQAQPCIEALNCEIIYQTNFNSNFNDSNAYKDIMAEYIDEANSNIKLVSLNAWQISL